MMRQALPNVHRRWVIPMVLALAGIASASWLASESSNATASPTPQPYSVLDRPASPSDAVADKPVSIADLAKDMSEVQAERARVLSANARRTVALVPRSDGKLCLSIMGANGYAAGGCADEAQAATRGIVTGPPGAQVGLVPDGVSEVTITKTDGSSETASVQSNLYWPSVGAASVTFEVAGQRQYLEFTTIAAAPDGVKVSVAPNALEAVQP